MIKTYILTLHGKYKKRLGVNKLTILLQREYGLNIGQTRVRRLFKSMNLPKIYSRKITTQSAKSESGDFKNLLNRKSYSTFSDLQISLFEYIDGFYNTKRPHSAIYFLSPADFESNFFYSI